MATATFDTLKHANALKAAGMPSDQAEALIASLSEVFQSNFKELATKEDVQRASVEIRQEFAGKLDSVKQELTGKHDTGKQEFNGKIDAVKQELLAKIDSFKQELNAKIDTTAAKLNGEIALLKWMMGINLTVTVGILIRLFFFRP
jgi:DNA anti-recombination protein RmuC